jgi:DNA-directed RNA polymerase beta subunit
MSLSDLKKSNNNNSSKTRKKDFTVDEFIADAENYALGAAEVVGVDNTNGINIEEAILLAKKHIAKTAKKHDKPFRHATFTLSEQAIAQLTQLAEQSNLAKSHIIRILINELSAKDQREQLQKLLNSTTD